MILMAISYTKNIKSIKLVLVHEMSKPNSTAFTLKSPRWLLNLKTLTYLLQKFYHIDEGEIYIDGINIREHNSMCISNHIGFVPEAPALLEGTIESNLLYGVKVCKPDELKKIIEKSGLKDILNQERFLEGLATQIGGSDRLTLSRGQEMKLILARMYLKDPKIIILPTFIIDSTLNRGSLGIMSHSLHEER